MKPEESNAFPFKCGRAMVYEDRVVVRAVFKKNVLDLRLEEIHTFSSSKDSCSIGYGDGRSVQIGSAPKASVKRLKDMLWKTKVQQIKSENHFTWYVPNVKAVDQWSLWLGPLSSLGALLLIFEPWDLTRGRLSQSAVFLYLLALLSIGLILIASNVMVFLHLKRQKFWAGHWQVDKLGLWRVSLEDNPIEVPVQSWDGLIDSELQYGGMKVRQIFSKLPFLVYELLTHHLLKAHAPVRLSPFWPRLLTPWSVPVFLVFYWYARIWLNFPVDPEEARILWCIGAGSVVVMYVINIYLRYEMKRWQRDLLERVEKLRIQLGWE